MRLTGRISVVVLSTMIALTGGLARANSVAATIEISSTGKVTVSPNLEASPPQFLENIDKNGGVIDVTVYNQSSSTINFTWNGYGETSGGSIISGIMTKAQDYTSFPANMTCAHSFNVAANSSSAGRWINLSIQNLSNGVDVLIRGYQRGLTYAVTYKPGANSNGNQVTATKYYGFALTLEEAIFTRQGYVQTGWATSDGGSKVYDLGGSYVANAAVTLYPVWTPHEATSYGLFVGIDEYDASKWQSLGLIVPNLLGCVVDAKSMKMTCLDYGDWQEDNVELFINGNVTVSQYRSKITSLASKAVAGDTVLIYHSGHGGNDPSSPKDAYLATYNGKYGDSDFAEDLGKFSTGVKIVVILDTCHSAGMFKGMAKDSLNFSRHTSLFVENVCAFLDSAHTKSATDRGTIQSSEIGWIAAADYDQTSAEVWANTSGGMGWFTGFMLVDGGVLNNMGDENDDGYMTFKELYSMISKLSVTLTDAVGLTQVVQAKNLDVLESVRLRSK